MCVPGELWQASERRQVVTFRLDSAAAVRLNGAMCGRFTLTATPHDVTELFTVPDIEDFPPRYNIAPTQPILVVLGGREARPDTNWPGRETRLVRWGLIPCWVKDLKGFPLLINARSETAAEKSTFRAALKYRRCLVPASGFYEWQRNAAGGKSQAFFLKPRSNKPIAFAGLMETWASADGSEIDTAAILTTAANGTLAPIHARMPVVIPEGAFERWLNCRDQAPADVAGLLGPADDRLFEPVAISDKVNKVANTGPDIQAPAAAPASSPRPAGDAATDDPVQASLF